MKLLLDTHALLWWILEPERLGRRGYALIEDGSNHVFLSAAVVWELAIKVSRRRLELPEPVEDLFARVLETEGFARLPVTLEHAARVARLPLHHRDPFDRILVAQAQADDLLLVSRDRDFAPYDVEVLW